MKKHQLIGPPLHPSVLYLSKEENLGDAEKIILEKIQEKANQEAVAALVGLYEQEAEQPVNHLFVMYAIYQMIKLYCKSDSIPLLLRPLIASETIDTEQKASLKIFLQQINMTCNRKTLPFIDDEIDYTVFEKLDEHQKQLGRKLSVAEKKHFLYKTAAPLFFEKGYYLKAYNNAKYATKKMPEKAHELSAILNASWLMVQGLEVGVYLKILESSINKEEEKLLGIEGPNPSAIKVNKTSFLGPEDAPSYIYLSDFRRFSAIERGAVFSLVKENYRNVFYQLKELLKKSDDSIDWYFIICVYDQLFKANNLIPSGYITNIFKKKRDPDEWKKDIKYCLEVCQRTLFGKKLPDIYEAMDEKAKELTNRQQKHEKANWSEKEWQCTFHRAQCYVYIRKGYYADTYRAAKAAEAIFPDDLEKIKTYLSSCEKFVKAEELGKILAENQVTQSGGQSQKVFQMMDKPIFYKDEIPSNLLEQLGVVDDGKLIGKIDVSGPTSITVTEANSAFLEALFTTLSVKIITKIYLVGCVFDDGRLPKSLFQFKELTHLGIKRCNISTIPNDIVQLKKLGNFSLEDMDGIKELPEYIGELTNLSYLFFLKLKNLQFLPTSIQHYQKLRQLNLSDCGLTTLPSGIWEISTLTSLYLENNQLTQLSSDIKNLANLKRLEINNNSWKILPENILGLPRLQRFKLTDATIDALEVEDRFKAALKQRTRETLSEIKKQDEFYRKTGR